MSHLLDSLMGAERLLREALSTTLAPATPTVGREPGPRAIEVRLCDTAVSIEIEEFGAGGPSFVNLHENEQTSVAAARAVLGTSKGRLIRLCSRGRRYVTFWDGARPYAFDPNRIFSDAGIRQTLLRFASFTDSAFEAVRAFRNKLLQLLDIHTGFPVVALHNNSGRDYTILEYGVGGRHAGDAAALCVRTEWPPEDFFVVTHANWFERLQHQGFNVVLQSPAASDDGSLSVWFQRSGLVYINVEARHGQLAAQQQMLRAIAADAPT